MSEPPASDPEPERRTEQRQMLKQFVLIRNTVQREANEHKEFSERPLGGPAWAHHSRWCLVCRTARIVESEPE